MLVSAPVVTAVSSSKPLSWIDTAENDFELHRPRDDGLRRYGSCSTVVPDDDSDVVRCGSWRQTMARDMRQDDR